MSGVVKPTKKIDGAALTVNFVDTVDEVIVGANDQIICYVDWTPGDNASFLEIESMFKADTDFFHEIVEQVNNATGEAVLAPKIRKIVSGGVGVPIRYSFAIPLGDYTFRNRFREIGGAGTLKYYIATNWLGPA